MYVIRSAASFGYKTGIAGLEFETSAAERASWHARPKWRPRVRATRSAISHFILGDLLAPGQTAFAAMMDGKSAIVRLDNAALFKLAPHISEDELHALLNDKRDLIALAAERLVEDGFWTDTDQGPEILVTAIDL